MHKSDIFCLADVSPERRLDELHLPVILQSDNECPACLPHCHGTHMEQELISLS